MIKVIITGSKGRMGQMLVSCAKSFRDLQIVGQIDQGDDLSAIIAGSDAHKRYAFNYETEDGLRFFSRLKEVRQGKVSLTAPDKGPEPVVPKSRAEIEKLRKAYLENFIKQLP